MQLETSISAIVTGGASGLGAATAQALADKGVRVTILDQNEDAGQSFAKTISGQFFATDVSDPESVSASLLNARGKYGQERIAINCAGMAPAAKTVSRNGVHDPSTFAKTIHVNLIGTFNVASQAAAGMATATPLETGERGLIINTSSIAAYDGQIGQIAYAASKGGVVGMTLPMARDLASLGIRVMSIAPGVFKTPMVAGLPDDVQDALGKQIPFPSRLGNPTEFAALVMHICENTRLNGEVIRLDGAMRMGPK